MTVLKICAPRARRAPYLRLSTLYTQIKYLSTYSGWGGPGHIHLYIRGAYINCSSNEAIRDERAAQHAALTHRAAPVYAQRRLSLDRHISRSHGGGRQPTGPTAGAQRSKLVQPPAPACSTCRSPTLARRRLGRRRAAKSTPARSDLPNPAGSRSNTSLLHNSLESLPGRSAAVF